MEASIELVYKCRRLKTVKKKMQFGSKVADFHKELEHQVFYETGSFVQKKLNYKSNEQIGM